MKTIMDTGFLSRKFLFSIFTSILIVGTAIYGIKHPDLEKFYSEMVFGLIGVTSLFFGANTFNQWTFAKNAKNITNANVTQQVMDEVVPPKKDTPINSGD